jgi:hypothetical protein
MARARSAGATALLAASIVAAVTTAPQHSFADGSFAGMRTIATDRAVRVTSFASLARVERPLQLYSALLPDAGHPGLARRTSRDASGHVTFGTLLRLPATEWRSTTYDLMPLFRAVIEQRVVLSRTVAVVFLGGRDVLRAELGPSQIGFTPVGFARGGVFTFDTRF